MHTVTLHIASIKIKIQSEIKGLIDRFSEFYHHFIENISTNEIDFTIEIKEKDFAVNIDTGTSPKNINFQGYAFQQLNKKALLFIPSLKNAYQYTEEFLLFIFSELCIKNNKLIFHSASLIDNKDNAYLFFGPSGIGKSTISKKLTSFKVFSDDMVVIEKTKSTYILHKTPFERNKQNKLSKKVQIKGFYRLIQSEDLKVRLLKKSVAFNSLLSNMWFNEYRKDNIEKYINTLQKFVENIIVAELYNSKSNSEFEIIEKLELNLKI